MGLMNTQNKIFNEIEKITSDILSVFDKMSHIPGMFDDKIEQSRRIAANIPEAIRAGILQIAVVGAIKSGKSTFVNALIKNDILQRGAGSITSVITRLRRGTELKAIVFLKSWDEINQEIEKALLLFPDMDNDARKINPRGFDLRRKTDRDFLNAVKIRLNSALSVTKEGIRPESALIAHAVDGYEIVKHKVMADPASILLDGDRFEEHKQFSGQDAVAFFVRDIVLYIPNNDFRANIEIADCQGSDSIDPSHMAKIQDYLLSANMLIYLISSRTGLREADIRFLKIIHKMGILGNVFFVLNADLNEHDELGDLLRVEKKVLEGLRYFFERPKIYTFSSLFNLIKEGKKNMSSKNEAKLHQWSVDEALSSYSLEMTQTFNTDLNGKIEKETFLLMFSNHLERLKSIAEAVEQRVAVFKSLLSEDVSMANTSLGELKDMQEENLRFETMLTNAMENSVDALKREIAADITSFFGRSGTCFRRAKAFIENSSVYDIKFEALADKTGFNDALYAMFQTFRTDLDRFMASELTPGITAFIQEQERGIEIHFKSLYQGYRLDPLMVCPDRFDIFKNMPESESKIGWRTFSSDPVDLISAKRILGLTYPGASFATAYSARIRVDALVSFGFYRLMEIFAKILKTGARTATTSSLKKAEKQIKKEALRSVIEHLNSYRERVWKKYLFPLLKAVARDFQDKTMERFHLSHIETAEIETLMGEAREKKEYQLNRLGEIESVLHNVLGRIDSLCIHYHTAMGLEG